MSTCMDACQCNYPPEILGQGDVWETPESRSEHCFRAFFHCKRSETMSPLHFIHQCSRTFMFQVSSHGVMSCWKVWLSIWKTQFVTASNKNNIEHWTYCWPCSISYFLFIPHFLGWLPCSTGRKLHCLTNMVGQNNHHANGQKFSKPRIPGSDLNWRMMSGRALRKTACNIPREQSLGRRPP